MLLLIYARPCHGALQTGLSLEDHTLAMHFATPVFLLLPVSSSGKCDVYHWRVFSSRLTSDGV